MLSREISWQWPKVLQGGRERERGGQQRGGRGRGQTLLLNSLPAAFIQSTSVFTCRNLLCKNWLVKEHLMLDVHLFCFHLPIHCIVRETKKHTVSFGQMYSASQHTLDACWEPLSIES